MIVSLGAAQFISNQRQQINVMEDRLSRLHLAQEVEQIFGNRELCRSLLKSVRISKNQTPQSIKIEDGLGRVVFDPNTEDNVYDHLRLTQAQIKNLSVDDVNSVGDIELTVHLQRIRQGGSNNQMTPVQVRLPVVIDNRSHIKSCYPKRAPICGDTLLLRAGKLPNPSKDFKNCCPGGGALSDCITTGLEANSNGNSIFYICTCE